MPNKYFTFLAVILLAVAAVIFLPQKFNAPESSQTPDEQTTEPDNKNTNPLDQIAGEIKDKITDKPVAPTNKDYAKMDKPALLAEFKKSASTRDYVTFAAILKQVYTNAWQTDKDFEEVEKSTYVFVDTTYFVAGDTQKALDISTIIYDQVPEGWRFFYLKVLCLEKFGRTAFNNGDLVTAEKYAIDILKMKFRPEGTNLLADVYIKKIEADIAAKNKDQATADYNYIKDFEVSQDRTDKLNSLATQINSL